MINWLYKYKYTKRGIEHLMKYIAIISAVIYVLPFIGIDLRGFLLFDSQAILNGQVWRLFTFVFLTPSTSIIFAAFSFYLYYIIGETLEREWGSFAFTVYYLLNIVIFAIVGLLTGGQIANSYYINLAMFLAYGFSYPENQVMLFMIIPIKMKYLAWIYVGFEVLGVITGVTLASKLIPLSSLLAFAVFFFPDLWRYIRRYFGLNQSNNRKQKPIKKKEDRKLKAIHKCEVCGRTELDDPDLQFRFCSRCHGYHEYCLEHLYMHEHKTN